MFNFVSELTKPLEGGSARKIGEQKPPENTATVLYVSRIPHGFYEKEMEGAFGFIYFCHILDGFCAVCLGFMIAFCRLFWAIWNHQEAENCEK